MDIATIVNIILLYFVVHIGTYIRSHSRYYFTTK